MANFSKLKLMLSKFFSKENLGYLLSPKESGYDFPKTILYATLLVAAAYGIYKVIKKLKIPVDRRLALAVAPYVVFGSSLRVVKDAGVLDSYLFVTPGIYVFVSSVFFVALAIAITLQKKFNIEYYKSLFVIGLLLIAPTISQLNFVNFRGVAIVSILVVPWIILFNFIKWSSSNKAVSSLHMFDATTTFVSISLFGYYEQHVIPTIIIDLFGAWSFVVVKFFVVVGVLYLIDKFTERGNLEEESFSLYLKLIIGILGAATGIRDFITLAAGI